VLAFAEGEVLGRAQRVARRQQPLRARVAREVEEERGALERAVALEAAPEVLGALERHADAGEDDREVLGIARAAALAGDLDREAVVRQAAAREERQLLAAHEAVHQVERRDAGLDEVARHLARDRVHRPASTGTVRCAAIGGPPSITSPTPLKTRPRMPGPIANCSGSPRKANDGALQRQTRGRFEHLDRHEALVDRGDPPEPRAAVAAAHLDRVGRPTSSVRLRNEERALRCAVAAPSTVSASLVSVSESASAGAAP
jgi:hypothetical protein